MLACGSEWSHSLQNGKTPCSINRSCLEPGAQHWVADDQLPYLQIGGKSIVLVSYVKIKQDTSCEPHFVNVTEGCKHQRTGRVLIESNF